MKISREGFKIITVSGIVCLALWLLIFYMLKANDLTWLIVLLSVLLLVFWLLQAVSATANAITANKIFFIILSVV